LRTLVVFITALLGAAVVSTVLFTALTAVPALWMQPAHAWDSIAHLGLFAFAVSVAHVVILGAPVFAILGRMRWIRWWSATLVGFVLGCLPTAIWSWPLKASGPGTSISVVEGKRLVQIMVNGVPTLAGWLRYAREVGEAGLCGAAAGFVFWYMWRAGMQALDQSRAAQNQSWQNKS
jgi:hypothetical protein